MLWDWDNMQCDSKNQTETRCNCGWGDIKRDWRVQVLGQTDNNKQSNYLKDKSNNHIMANTMISWPGEFHSWTMRFYQPWYMEQKYDQSRKIMSIACQVAQRSMERSILNIFRLDKISNEKIRERTGIRNIRDRVQYIKGQWAGHIANRDL